MTGAKNTRKSLDGSSGFLVAGLVFVCAILLGLLVLPRLGKKNQFQGGLAPEFALPVMNGKFERPTLRLSDLDGKVVILDFWASWCSPCREQAPIVERVAQRFAPRGVTLVGIATSDQRRAAENYAKTHPSAFPAVYDQDEATARSYGVQGLPTLAVVDRTGKIVALRSGLLRENELAALIEATLQAADPRP